MIHQSSTLRRSQINKDLFDAFDKRERSLTDFLERSRPPPPREGIANAMNNQSIDSQSFLSGNLVSHLHPNHTATAATTTMPVVYRHQQPSLIQVGGSIFMQHTAPAQSQGQQVLSFRIPSTHNNASSAALGSTESIFIRQPEAQIQQRYQQPVVLQQHGLTFMNPGNNSLHSTTSAHMYHDSTRNNFE